ncbi:hypothetical protein Ahia01_000517400 [Argonauta hians]
MQNIFHKKDFDYKSKEFSERKVGVSTMALRGVAYILTICLCCVLVQGECNTVQIHQALTGCQSERLVLSNTSQIHMDTNYTKLCKAFLNYIRCVEPKLVGCESSSLRGITIVKKTYSKDPYHCLINGTAQMQVEQSITTTTTTLTKQTSGQQQTRANISTPNWSIIWVYLILSLSEN